MIDFTQAVQDLKVLQETGRHQEAAEFALVSR